MKHNCKFLKTANESSPSLVIPCSLLLVIQVASIPVSLLYIIPVLLLCHPSAPSMSSQCSFYVIPVLDTGFLPTKTLHNFCAQKISSIKCWPEALAVNIKKFTKRKKRQKNPRVTSFDPIIM